MAFRGPSITLPAGLQGFSGSRNPSKLGPGHFSYVEGVDIDGEVLIKQGGAAKLNATPFAGNVRSGTNWSPVPGEYDDVIIESAGNVLKDTGAGTFPTTIAAGFPLTTVFMPFFLRAGGEAVGSPRRLFIFSEASQVKVINGTGNTMASISTPPADWATSFPIFGVLHANRVFAGGNASDPHRIYYSTTGNHQDYTGAGSGNIAIFPGEGEQLVAGLSFNGLLILWKYPRGIYVINTQDPTIANWSAVKLTDAVGGVSPQSVVQIGNDVLYLMNDGTFHLMSATQAFGDLNTSNISHDPNYIDVFMRANVSLINLRKTFGAWYAAKSKALYAVPLSGNSFANLLMTIDFNNKDAGPRYYLSRRDECRALWMRPDSTNVHRPVVTDSSGTIWKIDQDVLDKAGAVYKMEFETSESDFSFADPSLAAKTKNGAYVEVVADVVKNSSITIIPYWDGLPSDPIMLQLSAGGAVLDSFMLDVDALGSAGTVTQSEKLTGQGRRLRLNVSNNVLDDEVRIGEIRVGYTVADERTSNP